MVFIRSFGNVSPQKTYDNSTFLAESMEYFGNKMTCIEPDYKEIIDPKLIRRMGRIVKMGVAAALSCLREANIENPDAIITGTAFGCMEDSGTFLAKMVENHEEMLTPTSFIQSTHNTISAQIALLLKCHQYNNTFVHRGFSFESALLDAQMLFLENKATNILVGGVDEITPVSHSIMSRMGLYKRQPISNFDLYKSSSKGTIAGEGASFFLMTNEPSENNLAQLSAFSTFYKPQNFDEIKERILAFLANNSVEMNEIDLIILGKSGDSKGDKIFGELENSIFKDQKTVNYKHLCGEYATSTAFALWLATNIIKNNDVPVSVGKVDVEGKKISKILIYNHYQQIHHSLMLLSSC